MRAIFTYSALLFCAACTENVGEPGVTPPVMPPPGGGPECTQMCGEGPKEPAPFGDPMTYLGTATDNFGGFFEPVEIQVWGDRVALCTGVRGLAVYRASDSCCLSLEGTVRPAPTRQYPRCQHLATKGEHVYIANHGDEILPESFVSAVHVPDFDNVSTVNTHSAQGDESFEGLAVFGDHLYAAQHERGVAVFDIRSDGGIDFARDIPGGLTNAWQPIVDESRAILYVADAQGGIATFSLNTPRAPERLGGAPTVGTLKDIALSGNYAYGASGTAGIEVFDVSDPANVTMVLRIDTPGSALGIAATDKHLVVSDWNDVIVYSLADPAAPALVGHQKAYVGRDPVPTPLGRILDVTIRGGDFFMAEWQGVQAHHIVDGVDAPDIFVASTVELPRAEPGATTNAGFVIANRGRRVLELMDVAVSPPFSVEVASTTIEPGQQTLATIFFAPETPRSAEATLVITSNDPDEPSATIDVKGNLTGLRTGDVVPDLTFTDLDGFTTKLSDHRGKPVLLAYFATF